MSILINGEKYTTFDDYFYNEEKVSKEERTQIELEAALIINKMIKHEKNEINE